MSAERRSPGDTAIAGRLTAARKRAGMTQEEVVEALHLLTGETVGRDTLSQWECARRTISIRRLMQLAEVYRVRPSHLLEGEPREAEQVDAECAEVLARLATLDERRRYRALRSILALLDRLENEDVEVKILTMPSHRLRGDVVQ
ncbi:MAG: helix-turn-helix domain-containing protein [Chloroflexota bacterium]|nr:helix-turn-helix domain-containing protein [Chloroflexota bacterium]